ncbi:hypothetical protein Pelo_10755 [Pelomyxa schiedti]|nr:hypothetical protein Pelo_10755 [Pelomyxa schiedti]
MSLLVIWALLTAGIWNGEHRITATFEYMVLCFFIDGDGFRIPATNRAIIRASAPPISIVLVGVGRSPFANLSKFDADASSPVIKTDGKTVKVGLYGTQLL